MQRTTGFRSRSSLTFGVALAFAASSCGGRSNEDGDSTPRAGGSTATGGSEVGAGVGGTMGGGTTTAAGGTLTTFGGGANVTGGRTTSSGGSATTSGGANTGGAGLGGEAGASRGGSDGGLGGAPGGGEAGAGGEAGSGPECTFANGCVCPPNTGTDVYVDPVRGADNEFDTVHPTGVKYPAACRFATLTKALTKVTAGGHVIAFSEGAKPNEPAIFANETFPMFVPSGVTLRGSPTSGNYEIPFSGASGTAVTMRDGATFEGFVVSSGIGSGSLVSCSGNITATFRHLILKPSPYNVGLKIGCSAQVENVDVSGGTHCLSLEASFNAPTLDLSGATLRGCMIGLYVAGDFVGTDVTLQGNGEGLFVARGSVSLSRSTISDTKPLVLEPPGPAPRGSGSGVIVESGSLALESSDVQSSVGPGIEIRGGIVELSDVNVVDNGLWDFEDGSAVSGSGIYLAGSSSLSTFRGEISGNAMHGIELTETASVDGLELEGTGIHHNLLSGVQLDGEQGTTVRLLGIQSYSNGENGIVFGNTATLEMFDGNEIYANGSNQLLFTAPASGGTWWLGSAQGGCAAANAVRCYNGAPPAIAATPDAQVDAGYLFWQFDEPISGRDFSGPVNAHHSCGASMCKPTSPGP